MNKRVLIFTIVSCLFSWACWLPIVQTLETSPFESSGSVLLLFFLGAYGPTLTGILMSYFYYGREGLKALFKGALLIKVGFRWFLITLFTGPLIYAVAIGIYTAFGGAVGTVNYGLLPWIPVVFIVPIVFGPLAEELGWRGFALPLLDHKNKPVLASITIGFFWALWHTPLFWAKTGTAISGFPVNIQLIGLFFLGVIASSFIYTWLFNNTRGSIFIAIMLHLSMNASGTITGMLFPDMDVEQRFLLYQYYVVIVCMLVLVGGLLLSKKSGIRKTQSHSENQFVSN